MPTRRWFGLVGATAVPEAADPDEDAALWHLGGDRLVELERVGGLVAQVAPGHEPGGAVVLGEIGDSPHGVADDRDVGPGQRDELVVGVDRLRLLVGPDGDGRERRDEQTRIEHALDDGQHVGVHGDLLEGWAVYEEVVDPRGVEALEEVVGGDGAEIVFQLEKGFVDLVDEVGLDRVGEDGVAVLRDTPEVIREIRERTGGRGFRLAWCHGGNCTESARRRLPCRAGTGKWGNVPVVGSVSTGRWRSW